VSAALDASRVLEVRDAAILRLYHVGGFSQQMIAELFGITQARVSQILRAARAAYEPNESRDGRRRDRRSTRPALPKEGSN
jgi:predicted transcriptional regulator